MLFGDIGGNMSTHDSITLHDVDPEAMRLLLAFVHGREIELKASNVIQTLQAADMYEITELQEKCEEFVGDNVTSANCCSILTVAVQLGCSKVQCKRECDVC